MTIGKLHARIELKNDRYLDCTCVGEENGDAELFRLFALSYLEMAEAHRVVFHKDGKLLQTYTQSVNGQVEPVDNSTIGETSFHYSLAPS